MRDLLVSLPEDMRPRHGLEQELRSAIRSGQLAAGAAVPSTRSLAVDLGISRSTVVAAYEQLAVEGYLLARQGKSTVVAPVAIAEPLGTEGSSTDKPQPTQRLAHDFRPGEPTSGSFPRKEWQRSMRRVLTEAPDEAFGYGDPRGRVELRETLADYLGRARMVQVEPRSVRIYSGFASSLGFLGEMLLRRGIDRIAVEQPMLFFHRQILELTGLETVSVPVDEQGLDVAQLAACGARAVLVTPGNHQPLGVTMSSQRRNALIRWAESHDGLIIEDDYDGEFRYDRRPIAALQGLDPDRVLYAGTASKAMGPGLHLSWLVVPRSLQRDLAAVTHVRAGVSTIDQLALADMIDRGAYDRHVRQQRRVYQRRRVELHKRLSGVAWLTVAAGEAGMHLVAMIDDGAVSEADVLAAAERASVGLVGLETHFDHDRAGLVINVCRPANHHFATALDELTRLLASLST